jgi:AI-2 transport protein TqsA
MARDYAILLISAILLLALFQVGQAVFVPLAFALFIIALVWPLQAALQRRMPQLLALLVVLAVTSVLVIALASTMVWGFTKLGQWLFINAGRLQGTYAEWADWLEDHGIAIAGPVMAQFDVQWLVVRMQSLFLRLNSLAGFFVVFFVFVMLGLIEVEHFKARLSLPAMQPYGAKALAANREIGAKLRRYMLVRTFASILTGLVVWAFTLMAGMELATAWGAIAFALNYIPFLGPLIATVFPTLFALAQFETWQSVVFVFVSLNIIQFIIGSYIEPLVTGVSLRMSPSAVIFAIFFWTFVWGLAGTFMAVPILIVFIVYCAQFQKTGWIAALFSDRQ